MGKVFACFSIALHNFKKWAVNPRLYILLLIEVLYLHSRLSPVGELCVRTGYKVTPYLLPFLLDEGSAVMMLFLGVHLVRAARLRLSLRRSAGAEGLNKFSEVYPEILSGIPNPARTCVRAGFLSEFLLLFLFDSQFLQN